MIAPVLVAIVLTIPTACAGMRTEPTVEPTESRMVLQPLGTETITPTPTATPLPTVTPPPGTTEAYVRGAPGPEAPYLAAEPQCAVLRSTDLVTFTLGAEAPDDARAAWAAAAEHTFTGEVVGSDEGRHAYRLRQVEPASDYQIDLSYVAEALPIEPGKRYQFTLWADPPGAPPSGRAIQIADEAGLLVLIVNVRETEGASLRVLGGDRAGYAVRQAASQCRQGPYDACGYQLRAAPMEVARGGAWLSLDAGESGALAFEPPYVVTVRASHLRLPVDVVPCADQTDWVQSYRIQRQPALPTATPGA